MLMALYNNGQLPLNKWRIIWKQKQAIIKRLRQRNGKIKQMKTIGNWLRLTQGLLEKNGVQVQNKASASTMMIKSTLSSKRTKNSVNVSYQGHSALTPMERWEFLLKKIMFKITNNAKFQETSFSAAATMLIRREVKPKSREHKLNLIGRWAWMTRKLIHHSHRRSQKNCQQWKHFAISLIKRQRHYRLYVQYRLSKLVKNYIILSLCSKQINSYSKWRSLSKKLLRYSYKIYALRARRNWELLVSQMILQQESKELNPWAKAFNRVKEQSLIPVVKQRKIRIWARWNKLYKKVLRKADGPSPAMNERDRRLRVHGRLVQLIRKYIIFKGD